MKHYYLFTFIAAMLSMNASVVSAQSPRLALSHRAEQSSSGGSDEYGKLITVLQEDFSLFTGGTEESPAVDILPTDWGGSFAADKVHTAGWGGQKVHEAGGTAFIEEGGSLWTPNVDMTDAVDYRFYVSFRARLGEGSAEGVPSVQMGYNEPVEGEPLKTEWKEYRLLFSGVYSGTYLTFKATSAWMIDDIVIEKVMPFIDAPEKPYFSNYTVDGFKAGWRAVDQAAGYLLSVYSYSDAGDIVPCITDLSVESTSHVVSGLPAIEGYYYFTVKAVDAEGHVSIPSAEVCVEALVVPTGIEVTEVTDNGFTASWNTVEGARYYDVWIYRESTATADGTADLFNTDFSFVSANDRIVDEMISYDDMPGWIIYDPMVADGEFGLDGFASGIGGNYWASMESPAYDLSHDGGNVEISMRVKAGSGSVLTISLFTLDEESGLYPVYPESYQRFTDIATDGYETRTFTLTGGGKHSVILFKADDWGQVWFDDLRISQNVKAGDMVTTPFYSTLTETAGIEMSGVDLNANSKYFFMVRAVGDINQAGTNYVFSDFSDKYYVEQNSGIESVETTGDAAAVSTSGSVIRIFNPAGENVSVYDTTGRQIYSDNSGRASMSTEASRSGIYIVRIGRQPFKVLIP